MRVARDGCILFAESPEDSFAMPHKYSLRPHRHWRPSTNKYVVIMSLNYSNMTVSKREGDAGDLRLADIFC